MAGIKFGSTDTKVYSHSHDRKNALPREPDRAQAQRHGEGYHDLYSRVDRYDVKGRRHLDYPSKYYAVDTGLRNARLNFREFERAHLMENVVYNELVSRGYAVDVGVVDVWAMENGKRVRRPHEIDFVVNDGSRRIYIQSTFSLANEDQKKRETLPLRKTGDFFQKIIVTDGYELPRQDADGIVHMGVIPFLLNPKSVEG